MSFKKFFRWLATITLATGLLITPSFSVPPPDKTEVVKSNCGPFFEISAQMRSRKFVPIVDLVPVDLDTNKELPTEVTILSNFKENSIVFLLDRVPMGGNVPTEERMVRPVCVIGFFKVKGWNENYFRKQFRSMSGIEVRNDN